MEGGGPYREGGTLEGGPIEGGLYRGGTIEVGASWGEGSYRGDLI